MTSRKVIEYNEFEFEAEVILYPGDAAWYFAVLPIEVGEEINDGFKDRKRGWGSLPVMVTLGMSLWRTSIFTDKKSSSFILPIKSEIRKAEGVGAGSKLRLFIKIIV